MYAKLETKTETKRKKEAMENFKINTIYNTDCIEWMQSAPKQIDLVLTSPPYNTSRVGATDKYNSRYDTFQDFKNDADYIDWTIKVFNEYDNGK
jgi:DNA modification methylase